MAWVQRVLSCLLPASQQQLHDTREALRQALEQYQSGMYENHRYHRSHQERLDRLENLLPLAPQVFPEPPPFSWQAPPPCWLDNAQRRIDQTSAPLSDEARAQAFYSFYSEMGGDHRPILHQQYACYLPVIREALEQGGRVLDIGCGAGEWLHYLQAHDIPALGIDPEPLEVERATRDGLVVQQADAEEFLRSGDEQFAAITLLQVIEHLPPDTLYNTLEACLRRLRPGGVLMVETVNLRHPLAFNGFYTDPTHQKPLADNYLGFLMQWVGLQRLQLLYTLPEPLAGLSRDEPSRLYLNYTLWGYR